MAPRPTLKPLITPRTMIFPSELHDGPFMAPYSPTVKSEEGGSSSGSRTAITPPPAYTEFLNALTPVYGSEFPRSPSDKSPQSTTRPSFPSLPPSRRQKRSPRSLAPYHHHPPSSASLRLPATPSSASTPRVPYPERRLPLPTPSPSTSSSSYQPYVSADYYYTSSPRSAQSTYSYSLRSPCSPDWKTRHMESPRSASLLNVRHVVTRTVTYRQTPALHPPPRGRRRKNAERKEGK